MFKSRSVCGATINTERYRSGHNEAVLKTVWGKPHMGSNPILSASGKLPRPNKRHLRRRCLFVRYLRKGQFMDGTKLYFADVSPLEDEALFSEHYSKMPQYRREKIDILKRRGDKIRSLGAGVLLYRALESVGVDKNAEIAVGKNGKPFLKDFKNVHFNLSHSGDLVMCAISEFEVGCDVELVKSGRLDVAERFFTPEEREFICLGYDEKTKNESFFRLWTLKESFIKANGAGLSLPMNVFSVLPGENGTCSLVYDGKNYVFYEIDNVRGDYKAAVCVYGGAVENKPKIVFESF